MKKNYSKPIVILLVLLSTQTFFAQAKDRLEALIREQVTGNRLQVRNTNQVTGCRLQGTGAEMAELLLEDQIRQRTKATTNYELPTTNCNNQGDDLDYYLMMDPEELKNVEEGIEKLRGDLGSSIKTPSPSKTVVAITTTTLSPIENSSSSAVQSRKEAPRGFDEISEENNTTVQFLEEEICNNIYLSCLAKVATMPFAERTRIENILGVSEEAKEWVAAEQKAKNDVNKRQRELEEAIEEKKLANKEIDQVLPHRNEYGKDIIAKAYADQKVKECTEALAKARVVTAEATLFAIQVQGTVQNKGAQVDLEKAMSKEKEALKEFKRAAICAETLASAQSFSMASLPVAEAVAVYSGNYSYDPYPHSQQLSPLNLSPERATQERKEALAQKEKAAEAFEAEFSAIIKEAKTQAEDAAAVATTAKEKAEKQRTSEKEWNKAIEEAEIVEHAYDQLMRHYNAYREHVVDHYEGYSIDTKRSKYNIELKRAETKKRSWTTEIEECKQKKESLKHEESGKEKTATKEEEQVEILPLSSSSNKKSENEGIAIGKLTVQTDETIQEEVKSPLKSSRARPFFNHGRISKANTPLLKKANISPFFTSRFLPNTWYDEQIIAAEKVEQGVREQVTEAFIQLEEAQKVLKTLDDKIQEENGKVAKAKLSHLKRQYQVHLQELQTTRETEKEKLQPFEKIVEEKQRILGLASEETQKAKIAKEEALATTYAQFNQVGKDLVEGIEEDQKDFNRDQRILEAITKTDHERTKKEKAVQQLAAAFDDNKARRIAVKSAHAQAEATTLGTAESETAWEKVLKLANEVTQAWENTISFLKIKCEKTQGTELQADPEYWTRELSWAKKRQAHSTATVVECKTKKEETENEAKRIAEIQAAAEKTKKEEFDRLEALRVQAEVKAAAEKVLREKQELKKKAAEERARVAEQTRIERERKAAVEKARLEAEKKVAQEQEEARIEELARIKREQPASVEKTNDAEESGKRLAGLELKITKQEKAAVEYLNQAEKAELKGDNTNYDHFYKAGLSANNSASALKEASKTLEKATQAKKENKDEEAALWIKTTKQYEEVAEYYNQAVKTKLNKNNDDHKHFEDINDFVNFSDIALAETVENLKNITALKLKITKQEKEATEYKAQFIKAKLSGNANDYNRFFKACQYAHSSADALKETSKALKKANQDIEANRGEEAALWVKIAKLYEKAGEYYAQAVNAEETNQNEEDNLWVNHILFRVATCKEVEDAEYWSQGVKAKLRENNSDYDRFYKAAFLANSSAHALEETSEALKKAKEVNQEREKTLQLKIAQQNEEAAKYYNQAAKAKFNRNNTDYNRLKEIGNFTKFSVDLLERAFIALRELRVVIAAPKEANLEEKAALWTKIAQQYEETAEYYNQAAKVKLSINNNACDYFQRADSYANSSANELVEASELLKKTLNQREEAALQLKIVQQKEETAKYYVQAAKAKLGENNIDYDRLSKIGVSANNSASALKEALEALKKATQAKEVKQGEEAALWIKTAEQYEESAEYYIKAVKAKLNENDPDYQRFYRTGFWVGFHASILEEALVALKKATQARDTNQGKEAIQWQKIAQQYEESAEYYSTAVKAYLNGNDIDYNCFSSAGYFAKNSASSLKEASEALKKATQARDTNQGKEAIQWQKIAQQKESIADYYAQAVKIQLYSDKGIAVLLKITKQEEAAKYYAQVEKNKLSGNMLEQNEEDDSSVEAVDVSNSIRCHTDYNCFSSASAYASCSVSNLENALEALRKAVQAKAANQGEEEVLQLKIAKQYEESAEYYSQTAAKFNEKFNADCNRFYKAACSACSSANALENASEALKKAAQAKEANQEEEASLQLKIVKQYEESAEYYSQAAKIQVSENDTDYQRFYKEACFARSSANALENASEALKKAVQAKAANQGEEEVLQLKIAKQYEESAEYYSQAAKIQTSENNTDYQRFHKVDDSLYFIDDALENASKALKKAAQAKEESQGEEVALQLKIAKQYEESAEYYGQAVKAKSSGNNIDCDRFDDAGKSSRSSANALKNASEALKKAVQAKAANQGEEEVLQLKIAKQYEESAGYYTQAAKAKFNENDADYERFDSAAKSSTSSARALEKNSEVLKKTTQLKEANQGEEVALWIKIAKQCEKSAEYYAQAAKAKSSGNKTDCDRFYNADYYADISDRVLENASETLGKAAQAREENQGEEVTLWIKITKQYEESAEYYGQAIKAYLNGNDADCECFHGMGASANFSANSLEEEAGKKLKPKN